MATYCFLPSMSPNLYLTPYSVLAFPLRIFNKVSSCTSAKLTLSFSSFLLILAPKKDKKKYSKYCRSIEPNECNSDRLLRRMSSVIPNAETPTRPTAVARYNLGMLSASGTWMNYKIFKSNSWCFIFGLCNTFSPNEIYSYRDCVTNSFPVSTLSFFLWRNVSARCMTRGVMWESSFYWSLLLKCRILSPP